MTDLPATSPGPADLLLHLARRVRQTQSLPELRFIAVNETRALASFRQSALWLARGDTLVLSGVVAPEANAPYAQWLQRVFRTVAVRAGNTLRVINDDLLDPQDAAEWPEWLPAHGLWMPFAAGGGIAGGLLLARDEPWQPEALQVLGEWRDIWWHAYETQALRFSTNGWLRRNSVPTVVAAAASKDSPRGFSARATEVARHVWQSPWKRAGFFALLVSLLPVRLSVLAPGELVPKDPSAIRAPLEGTVDRFFVSPNEQVKKGQPLLQLDLTALRSRHSVAMQEFATAEAEYRQSAQQAVFDPRSKAQLAALQGRISERQTEVAYLEAQLTRAQLVAPRDGIVLMDDPSEWVGKPVATGEKVMTIADEYEVEVEAWLTPGDLIDLPAGTPVKLYLNAAPMDPVIASLQYAAHEAVARPDGTYAYRLRADVEPGETQRRVGLKGTVRVSGDRVPLVYWVLRRPLAILRPYLGI